MRARTRRKSHVNTVALAGWLLADLLLGLAMLFFVFNTVGPEPAEPTATPTNTPTVTPTVTLTATPTVTPRGTPTVTPTATPTVTSIPSPTPTPVQSGLDLEAEERIIKTNADILLGSDDLAKEQERTRIQQLIRDEFEEEYDGKGRAGFVLIWGYAPTISEGNRLAAEVNQLLEPALENVFKGSARKELHWVITSQDDTQRGDVGLEVYFLLGETPTQTPTPPPTAQLLCFDLEAEERIIKTNADILLGSDDFAKEEERARIQEQIRDEFEEYDGEGRAGFVLVWGYAPTISEGNRLAAEVNQQLEPALENVFKDSVRKEWGWVPSDSSQRGDVRLEVYFQQEKTPTATGSNAATPTPAPGLCIDLALSEVTIKTDVNKLLGSDGPAKDTERTRIQEQIREKFGSFDGVRRVGFVLITGYAAEERTGDVLASEVNQQLEPALENVFKGSVRRELHWITPDPSQRGDVKIEAYFLLGGP